MLTLPIRTLCGDCLELQREGRCVCGDCGYCLTRGRLSPCFCVTVCEVFPEQTAVVQELQNPVVPPFTNAVGNLRALELIRVTSRYHQWRQLLPIPRIHPNLARDELQQCKWLSLFEQFFRIRHLDHLLVYVRTEYFHGKIAFHFAYTNVNDLRVCQDWVKVAHGTSWQLLRSIALNGGPVESIPGNGAQRAANYGCGVYSTCRLSSVACNLYSTPQDVFHTGNYHKVVLSLLAHPQGVRHVVADGRELLGPSGYYKLVGLYAFPDTGASIREPRIGHWIEDGEA
jgi:hypothetical protein